MANRNCNGKFFRIIDEQWYRCMWDGALMKIRWFGSLKNGDKCPNCQRKIDGTDAGPAEQFLTFKVFGLSDGSGIIQ